MNTRADEHRNDEFYVGYLPVPGGVARFAWGVSLALLIAFGAIGALFAGAQRDPGNGSWNDATLTTLSGTLVMMPYPMLIEESGEGVLIVEPGKFGSGERLAPFDGKQMELRGTMLQRERWRVIELDSAAESVVGREEREVGKGREDEENLSAVGGAAPAVMVGEIIDPKCFLGAMRPGEGKTHKACAALCLFGGIPPVLVTRDASGAISCAIIMTADGREANEMTMPLAGEMVRVEGSLGRIGGWDVIRAATIAPLHR